MSHSRLGLRRVIESEMVDNCSIQRDQAGTDDDTIDQTTGLLTPPVSDTQLIYSGPAMVYPFSASYGSAPEGDRIISDKDYMVRIPLAPSLPLEPDVPLVGDSVIINKSSRDPSLVGAVLRITSVEHSTFATSRNMMASLRTAARP